MPLPVTVYRWDDPGAPQLVYGQNTPSQYFDIFKKCLVEGYGDKAPLGWTLPFASEDGLQLVFRNSPIDGSGSFVKFWASSDANGGTIYLRSALLLTQLEVDWDNMLNAGAEYKINEATLDTRTDAWALIGAAAGCYFISSDNALMTIRNNISETLFMGDINSFYAHDVSRFVAFAGDGNGHHLGFLNGAVPTSTMHEVDGNHHPKIMKTTWRFASYADDVIDGVPAGQQQFNELFVYMNDTDETDSEGTPARDSDLHPNYRGTLPGLLQSSRPGYSDQPWPVVSTFLGREYFLIPNTYSYGGCCCLWIDMEQWYD